MLRLLLIPLALLTLLPQPSRAGWGPSGCAAPVTVVTPTYRWQSVSGTEFALYRNGVQIGNYDTKADVYREMHPDGSWGPIERNKFGARKQARRPTAACRCDPCACPDCECAVQKTTALFGVDSDKLHKDGVTRHYLNGEQVSRQEAHDALSLTDDSGKPFVSFIGEGREALAKAFAATPESAHCRVGSFTADAWQVKDAGFVTSGHPTVYVQNAKGEVLYRGDNPSVEAVQVEARKADPSYDPSKDPTGAVDVAGSVVAYVKAHSSLAVLGGLVGLVLFLLRNRN